MLEWKHTFMNNPEEFIDIEELEWVFYQVLSSFICASFRSFKY